MMIRKFFILLAALAMLAPPLVADAASKKAVKSSINAKKSKTRVKHSLKAKHGKAVAKTSKRLAIQSSAKGKMRLSSKRAKQNSHSIAQKRPGGYQFRQANFHSPIEQYDDGLLHLASSKALVINQLTGEVVYAKNTNEITPIASVTKLMTAMVVLDAQLALDEYIMVSDEDVDMLKGTGSRLAVGTTITRGELMQLALMASENRAASALGRNYPGGTQRFVRAMNQKALDLGMKHTYFVDSSGLNSANVSTAEDLAKMVKAAYQYPEIRQITTQASYALYTPDRVSPLNYVNTNGLVRNSDWVIGLSKTGFISEAGRCLVMQAELAGKPMIIVLLDSAGKNTRIGDAQRIRKWVEENMADTDDGSLVFEKTLG